MQRTPSKPLEEGILDRYGFPKEKKDQALYLYYGVLKIKPEIYPSGVEFIDGKPVMKRNEYMLGENILGLCWTYSGLIEILEGLQGRDKEKVLEHELGHREFPMRSEEENRRKTATENYETHPAVSYTGK